MRFRLAVGLVAGDVYEDVANLADSSRREAFTLDAGHLARFAHCACNGRILAADRDDRPGPVNCAHLSWVQPSFPGSSTRDRIASDHGSDAATALADFGDCA